MDVRQDRPKAGTRMGPLMGLLMGGWLGAMTVWGQAPAAPAPGPERSPSQAGSKVTEVGAADARETGKLPPLTTELSQRAAAAVSKRDWASAREAYREMLVGEPDNALALANLGAVEFQLRDLEAAVDHLEQAVRKKPNLTQTWLTLGMAQYEREDHLRALSAISRAVAEKPDDARARNYLAATAKALGWMGAAESELQRALDLDPDYAEAHYNLALIYLERRPPALEMARRHYLKAVELGTSRDPLVEKQLDEEAPEETAPAPAPAPTAAEPPKKKAPGGKPVPSKPSPQQPATRKPKG